MVDEKQTAEPSSNQEYSYICTTELPSSGESLAGKSFVVAWFLPEECHSPSSSEWIRECLGHYSLPSFCLSGLSSLMVLENLPIHQQLVIRYRTEPLHQPSCE